LCEHAIEYTLFEALLSSIHERFFHCRVCIRCIRWRWSMPCRSPLRMGVPRRSLR
jgi:hypothetical protein